MPYSDIGKDGNIVVQENLDIAVGHADEHLLAVLLHRLGFRNQLKEVLVAAFHVIRPDFREDGVDPPDFVWADQIVGMPFGVVADGGVDL